VIIQLGVPSDFARAEREEDDIWQVQFDVGAQIEAGTARALQLHRGRNFSISNVSASSVTYPFLIAFIWHPLTSFCSQQLMQMSRDKSVELARQYSRVNWLERYNASLVVRLGEANALVSDLELELELARANGERDAQRAEAEQKAQESESQAATQYQNAEELEARVAELQRKEAVVMALTDTLVEKDDLLETQGVALRDVETALKEREASLSALQQQVNAARAQLEKERERTEGKCQRHNLLKLFIVHRNLSSFQAQHCRRR
jgi:hypothetical protein